MLRGQTNLDNSSLRLSSLVSYILSQCLFGGKACTATVELATCVCFLVPSRRQGPLLCWRSYAYRAKQVCPWSYYVDQGVLRLTEILWEQDVYCKNRDNGFSLTLKNGKTQVVAPRDKHSRWYRPNMHTVHLNKLAMFTWSSDLYLLLLGTRCVHVRVRGSSRVGSYLYVGSRDQTQVIGCMWPTLWPLSCLARITTLFKLT